MGDCLVFPPWPPVISQMWIKEKQKGGMNEKDREQDAVATEKHLKVSGFWL